MFESVKLWKGGCDSKKLRLKFHKCKKYQKISEEHG